MTNIMVVMMEMNEDIINYDNDSIDYIIYSTFVMYL